MARAAIYLRRSDPGEEDKNSSIETQRSETMAQAQKSGHTVVEEYSDPGGRSMTLNRPILNRLMLDAKLKKFDVIIIWKWDRFSRDQDQAAVAFAQLKNYEIAIEAVHDKVPDGPIGTLIRQLHIFSAQMQRESIVLNIRAGKKARSDRGHLNSRPRPLYGYMWADEKHERYIPNPTTAPVVQRIFSMALERIPLIRICDTLDAAGIPMPSGKRSRVGSDLEGWRRSGVFKILNNPAYKGHMVKNRMETYVVTLPDPQTGGFKDVLRSRPRKQDDPLYGEYGPDTCPPLVSEDDWEAVQRLLERNRKESSRRIRAPEDALLRSGFARCGYCGRAIVCAWNKEQQAYRYRCCSVGRGLGCEGKSFSWTCRELDTYVWDWTERAVSDEQILRAKYERWKQLKSTDTIGERDQLNAARLALREAEERYNSYAADIGMTQNANVRATLIKSMEDADNEKQAHLARIAKLEETLEYTDSRVAVLDDFIHAASRWLKNIQHFDFDSKRRLLDAFGIRAIIKNKKDKDPVQMEWALGEMKESMLVFPTTKDCTHS